MARDRLVTSRVPPPLLIAKIRLEAQYNLASALSSKWVGQMKRIALIHQKVPRSLAAQKAQTLRPAKSGKRVFPFFFAKAGCVGMQC